MKTAILALLIAILLVGITNVLFNLGVIGSNSTPEYRVLNSDQMDIIGFKSLAKLNSITIDEGGDTSSVANDEIRVSFRENSTPVTIDFPKQFASNLVKTNLLPFTLRTIEKDGWQFISVSSDNHYIFRK